MKRILIITASILVSITAMAGRSDSVPCKRFTFGAEWNYIASFSSIIHHNFFSEIGYRVDIKDRMFEYKSNADLYLHCGLNMNENWNVSLYAGIAGVYDINKVVPISLRFTRYFRPDEKGDRWFAFLDGGSGISLSRHPQSIACGKAGGGFRLAMNQVSMLDFIVAFRMTLTHPELEFDGFSIPADKINRNNALVSAVSVGLSLTF